MGIETACTAACFLVRYSNVSKAGEHRMASLEETDYWLPTIETACAPCFLLRYSMASKARLQGDARRSWLVGRDWLLSSRSISRIFNGQSSDLTVVQFTVTTSIQQRKDASCVPSRCLILQT